MRGKGERGRRPEALDRVLAKAAELQRVVPGAVLVGGAAAALHAGHRISLDHDHVVADLEDRFDTVLANLEALGDFSLVRVQPGKIILGSLGDIDTGVRQLMRARPLETTEVETADSQGLIIPTAEEILRIKAWLVVSRNQVRDHLDVAALADRLGIEQAAAVLAAIDDYYADVNQRPEAVATQVARQLADPRPRDRYVIDELDRYKGLAPRWHEWDAVVEALGAVAERMVTGAGSS